MKPFWRYYGGKWRAAPRYPEPKHRIIVEPFAGAAGYSCRYPDRDVILIDKYPVIVGIWDWLIRAPSSETLRIPYVEHVDDLPGWVSQGARDLVGFWLNSATVSPCRQLSSGRKKLASMGRNFEGWTAATRERIASQQEQIRHWCVRWADCLSVEPSLEATWFVDPPYNNRAGSYYVHSDVDYQSLGSWCRRARGQIIVCENEGANWLPFESFGTFKAGVNGSGSREVVWCQG